MNDCDVKSEPVNGICRTCLGHRDLKHFYEVHNLDGKPELYPEIIFSCFNIDIIPITSSRNEICMICENCIARLRDAYGFKQQIEASMKLFEKHLESSILKHESSNENICDDINFFVTTEMSHDETDDDKRTMKTIKKRLRKSNNKIGKVNLKIRKRSNGYENIKLKKLCRENPDDIEKNITINRNVYELDKDDLTCKICNETFPLHYNLVRHLSVHFPNFVCDVCGGVYSTERSLKSHRLCHTNNRETCPICKKSYKRDHLKRHIKLHNTSLINKCPKCPEKFSCYYKRIKHLVEVHNDEPNKYKCKQCPKRFSGAGLLSRHIRRDHLQERKHTCHECGSAFFGKRDLSRHMLKHTGIKDFQCEVCNKSFQRKYHLNEHMKIHTNEKRHECPVCNRRFTQKCTLKGHMNTHNKSQIPIVDNSDIV